MLLCWGWLPHYVVDLPNYGLLNVLRWLGLVQLQAGVSLGLQEKLQVLLHLLQLELVVHDVQALLEDLLVAAVIVHWRWGRQWWWLQHGLSFPLLEVAQVPSHSCHLHRSLGVAAVKLLSLGGRSSTALLQLLRWEGLSQPAGHCPAVLLWARLCHLPGLGDTPRLPVLGLQAELQGKGLLLQAPGVAHVWVGRLGLAWLGDAEAVGAAHGGRALEPGGELGSLGTLQVRGWGGGPVVQRALKALHVPTQQHVWVRKVSTFHCETPWKENQHITPSCGLDKFIQLKLYTRKWP